MPGVNHRRSRLAHKFTGGTFQSVPEPVDSVGNLRNVSEELTFMTVALRNGWWFVGRPTLEELRQDMRALMQACRQNYHFNGPSLASVERGRRCQRIRADAIIRMFGRLTAYGGLRSRN
jgi:hypothetical protein